jgi:hypothetical protein
VSKPAKTKQWEIGIITIRIITIGITTADSHCPATMNPGYVGCVFRRKNATDIFGRAHNCSSLMLEREERLILRKQKELKKET